LNGSINVMAHSVHQATLPPTDPQPLIQQTSDLPAHAYWTANSIIYEATLAALEYAKLKLGVDGKEWIQAAANKMAVWHKASSLTCPQEATPSTSSTDPTNQKIAEQLISESSLFSNPINLNPNASDSELKTHCSTHPDATIRYYASAMQLHVHSDASYLSESQARSRYGGNFFLSTENFDPTTSPSSPDSAPP
jgi:hypothetical protein